METHPRGTHHTKIIMFGLDTHPQLITEEIYFCPCLCVCEQVSQWLMLTIIWTHHSNRAGVKNAWNDPVEQKESLAWVTRDSKCEKDETSWKMRENEWEQRGKHSLGDPITTDYCQCTHTYTVAWKMLIICLFRECKVWEAGGCVSVRALCMS